MRVQHRNFVHFALVVGLVLALAASSAPRARIDDENAKAIKIQGDSK